MRFSDSLVAIVSVATLCGGCGDGSDSTYGGSPGGGSGDTVAPLSFFEEALVGHWSRYHGYDDSDEYFIFKSDRTSCYFEITSTGSRRDVRDYAHWELSRPISGYSNAFYVDLQYADGAWSTAGHQYYYNEDVLLYGGYDNLAMWRSSGYYDCE